MARNSFLTAEEREELRREMEGLTRNQRVFEEEKPAPAPEPEGEGEETDSQALSDIIDETNTKLLSIEENGSYVKIAKDGMCAWLYLAVPGEGRDNYTMDELKDFLKQNGVIMGYHQSNLAAMIKKKVYEREIVAAQGQPAIEGTNGFYEYMFDVSQRKAPKVLANGRVDYTNMSSLQNVHEGDVVAIYHHAKEGLDGYDVRGKTSVTKKVNEAAPLSGQVYCKEDNPDIYLAEQDGKIEFKDGKVDIRALHEINGDVTLITGKVEFFGDVVINGSVEAGVVIRAGRNIEIKGNVEAVSLFAGGDIILGRGIQGAQRAKLSARGDIYADFIEHTVAMAGGNVQANTILNSRIAADGQVILTGKKGAIIGGYTHAMMGITATEIGNFAEARTVVHVGCEKDVYEKMQNFRTKDTALLTEITEVSDQINDIRQRTKKMDKIPDGLALKLKTLESKLDGLKAEQGMGKEEIKKMSDLIEQGKGSEIVISGNVYRGTVVCFAQAQMPIERDTCFMKYYQQNGLIESSVIAYSSS
ncbi:MAG: FapA family protein [Clostridium sp.]|nr:FapA family protein [Clostridium sp.]